MANRKLVHVLVKSEFEKIVPVFLHWLQSDEEWLEKEYADKITELCSIVAENMDEFEKNAKSDNKLTFRRVAGHSKISLAVAVQQPDASSHSVFVIGDQANTLYHNSSIRLVVWIGPYDMSSKNQEMQWPVDCIC